MRDNMYVYIHHHIILILYKIINIYGTATFYFNQKLNE